MMRELASWLPDRQLHLCADGAYATLAGADLPRTQVTSRMRRDGALYEAAPPRTGKRARPRLKGQRLPTPPKIAAQARPRDWSKVTVDVRGRKVEQLTLTRDVLWYRVNAQELVRLVIVRDPSGVEPDDFFVTTDLTASGADTASRYAGRWSIEGCLGEVKQDLGGENPQSWKRKGPERAACLSLWLHAMTWSLYLTEHPAGDTWIPRPWYPRKSTPSFLDALAALRRSLWTERISAETTCRRGAAAAAPRRQIVLGQFLLGRPVLGSRNSLAPAPLWVPPESEKENRLFRLPAFASKEKLPMRPVLQLSSMKRRIDDWSVVVWSTKLAFAYGETTTRGRRGP